MFDHLIHGRYSTSSKAQKSCQTVSSVFYQYNIQYNIRIMGVNESSQVWSLYFG